MIWLIVGIVLGVWLTGAVGYALFAGGGLLCLAWPIDLYRDIRKSGKVDP